MAVVVDQFEANVEAGGEGSPGGKGAEMKPRDLRRQLRGITARALRVRPR